jgi:hypothetical protein
VPEEQIEQIAKIRDKIDEQIKELIVVG